MGRSHRKEYGPEYYIDCQLTNTVVSVERKVAGLLAVLGLVGA
jgi:hypothetical protein